MTQEQIKRIGELYKKSQTPEGLTEAERAEQAFVRRGYLDAVKANLRAQLDGIRRAEE